MIDIHFHLLYGVDDGPETIEESIEMLKIAKEQGISKEGDAVILASGSPNGLVKGANTNLIKVDRLK